MMPDRFRLVTLCAMLLLALAAGQVPGAGSSAIARGWVPAEGAAITKAYLVGVWETHNSEHGRDVRIVWTVRADSSLDYDFVVDGVGSRGSTGTWDFRDGTLYESWVRPDGSTGAGHAALERIDENTFRLTVIDNGDPGYRGLVRIYRRLGPAQTVDAWPHRRPR